MENKCNNCEFRKFMDKFGKVVGVDYCWIACTDKVFEDTQKVFGEINHKTYISKAGLVIYTGNADNRLKDFIEARLNKTEDVKIHINDFLNAIKKDENKL